MEGLLIQAPFVLAIISYILLLVSTSNEKCRSVVKWILILELLFFVYWLYKYITFDSPGGLSTLDGLSYFIMTFIYGLTTGVIWVLYNFLTIERLKKAPQYLKVARFFMAFLFLISYASFYIENMTLLAASALAIIVLLMFILIVDIFLGRKG